MSAKNTISLTEARKRIFELAKEVQKPGAYYILTDKGKPRVVMLSVDEFESLIETLEVMEDFPELERDIAQAKKEIEEGDVYTLDEVLASAGYVLADKSKKYNVPNRPHKNRPKRARNS
jgi:antitoxin YefM